MTTFRRIWFWIVLMLANGLFEHRTRLTTIVISRGFVEDEHGSNLPDDCLYLTAIVFLPPTPDERYYRCTARSATGLAWMVGRSCKRYGIGFDAELPRSLAATRKWMTAPAGEILAQPPRA